MPWTTRTLTVTLYASALTQFRSWRSPHWRPFRCSSSFVCVCSNSAALAQPIWMKFQRRLDASTQNTQTTEQKILNHTHTLTNGLTGCCSLVHTNVENLKFIIQDEFFLWCFYASDTQFVNDAVLTIHPFWNKSINSNQFA